MKYRDIDRAIKVASKKIRVIGDSKLRHNLDMAAGGDACEAYRMGVEEAQGEIIQRLEHLKAQLHSAQLHKERAESESAP